MYVKKGAVAKAIVLHELRFRACRSSTFTLNWWYTRRKATGAHYKLAAAQLDDHDANPPSSFVKRHRALRKAGHNGSPFRSPRTYKMVVTFFSGTQSDSNGEMK